MTAKEYLRQIGAMEAKTDLNLDRVASIRESIRRVKAVHYGETKTRAKGVDRMAGELGELEALEQRTAREVKELEKMKTGITEQIKKVKNQKYIRLLYLRYVKGEKLEEIAEEMGYALRHINRMHGDALREFAKANKEILGNS